MRHAFIVVLVRSRQLHAVEFFQRWVIRHAQGRQDLLPNFLGEGLALVFIALPVALPAGIVFMKNTAAALPAQHGRSGIGFRDRRTFAAARSAAILLILPIKTASFGNPGVGA